MRGWARLKFSVFERINRFALSHFAHVVIAVSRHTAAALRQSGYRPRSLQHIYNGIDMVNIRATRTRQDVRDELGYPSDSVLIGTAARLTAVKAQDDFIRAAQLMLARHSNFRFVLVGEGPEERTLKALARQMGIEGHIVFAGGRRDVHDLIAAMDVFVLPSLDEGCRWRCSRRWRRSSRRGHRSRRRAGTHRAPVEWHARARARSGRAC